MYMQSEASPHTNRASILCVHPIPDSAVQISAGYGERLVGHRGFLLVLLLEIYFAGVLDFFGPLSPALAIVHEMAMRVWSQGEANSSVEYERNSF